MDDMSGYFPLDRELLNSTIWINGDSDVRSVWVYLLLSADINTGIVSHSIPAIANANPGVSICCIRKILEEFMEPDPDSRTSENEGRRIEYVDKNNPNGGIRILNYRKYKEKFMCSTERNARYDERYEAETGKKRRHRATRGDEGRQRADKEKENKKEKELINLPDSEESSPPIEVDEQIRSLEAKLQIPISELHDARDACARTRDSKRMSNGVWLKVLQEFKKHKPGKVRDAIWRYTDKRCWESGKNERYLIGIIRGMEKEPEDTRNDYEEKPLESHEVVNARRVLGSANESYKQKLIDSGEWSRMVALLPEDERGEYETSTT